MMTMVPGFNTDFKYRGETYHVQTEDTATVERRGISPPGGPVPIVGKTASSKTQVLMKNSWDPSRSEEAGTTNGAAPTMGGNEGHPATARLPPPKTGEPS
jgi:hypothetical protein